MELNILRADPAGNITVFVLDPVEKAQRAAIAEKIMAIPALKAEQVGYACTAEDEPWRSQSSNPSPPPAWR